MAKQVAAFPIHPENTGVRGQEGMTLLDYFAAHVATALCSHEKNILAIAVNEDACDMLAQDAYKMAKALMTERRKH